MRARELFLEQDYADNLRSEIITLLTTVSAEGIDEVNTDNLLNDLADQGFAIDKGGLIELLSTLDIVSTASDETIQIATSDADYMVGQDAEEFEQDRVGDLATSQATKDMGESENVAEGDIITGPWKNPAKAEPVSMRQAFGGEEYNVIRDMGFEFSEKPGYLSDISARIPKMQLARIQRELGRKLTIYNIDELLRMRAGEYYPQTTPIIQMPDLDETIIVHDVNERKYYLANKTGAQTYLRMWAKIE